jgi:hypothetical protein
MFRAVDGISGKEERNLRRTSAYSQRHTSARNTIQKSYGKQLYTEAQKTN